MGQDLPILLTRSLVNGIRQDREEDMDENMRRLIEALAGGLGGGLSPAEIERQRRAVLVDSGVSDETALRLMALSADGVGRQAVARADEEMGNAAPVSVEITAGLLYRLIGMMGYAIVGHMNELIKMAQQAKVMGTPLDAMVDPADVRATTDQFVAIWDALHAARAAVESPAVPDTAESITG